MKIAISGTASQGKTTLLSDFLTEWTSYTTPKETYRSVLKKDDHSKNTTEDTQWNVLNHMIDSLQEGSRDDNVIYDRCPLDNLVYSMWAHEKGDLSKDFIDKCIPIVREAMRSLDIIFFTPLTKSHKVAIEDDGTRETDPVYIREIDTIFKTLLQYYHQDVGPFFIKDDKPAIIEVFGTPMERVQMIKMYLDTDGDAIGGDMNSVINPNEIAALEEQFKAL